MNEALRCIYDSIRHRTDKSFEDFVAGCSRWNVIPLKANGKVIGGVLYDGVEIHVGYSSHPGASMRSHVRKTLNEAIRLRGSVLTKVAKENRKGIAFCHRLGFKPIGMNGDVMVMKCERSNYA